MPAPRSRAARPTARRPPTARRARLRRRTGRATLIVAGLVAAAAVFAFGLSTHHAKSAPAGVGPEGVALEAGAPLASADTTAAGQAVDGVSCLSGDQISYHIHVHLSVFVNGQPRQLPAGIGIVGPRHVQQTPAGDFVDNGSCFYWLHTHAADGIIHVESPAAHDFTLGDFFDIWRQPLGDRAVGPARGMVTVFIDSHRAVTSPRDITLAAHKVIELDVGRPLVPPRPVMFPPGL
jgi:hypothetical protein